MNSTRKLMSLAALVLLGTTTAANATDTNTAKMSFNVTQADAWALAWKPSVDKLDPGKVPQKLTVGALDITRLAGPGARAKLILSHQANFGNHKDFSWENEQTGNLAEGVVRTANNANITDGLVIGYSAGGTTPIETGNTVTVQMQVNKDANLEPGTYSATATVATYKE